MIRKYAFNMILAGHRYSKSAQVHKEKGATIWGYYRELFALTTVLLLFVIQQRKHSLRCYRQALYVYNEKSWHLAEVCVILLLAFLFFS